MDLSRIDWDALHRLRQTFLENPAGAGDYWQCEADLASYDATFAQRIGWKWDYVFQELQRREWSPPKGELLDWGCGSGIASRAFLDRFGVESVAGLNLWDRSTLATSFAANQARTKYPGLATRTGLIEAPAVLLLSHVLTELTSEQMQTLVDFASAAQTVIWVEPGTYDASLTLIAVRERLRSRMNVVAPCTHQERCGILAQGNERHWCHHFASPPPGVFTDGDWSKFANLMGIDLRDLPLSFLVLDHRPPITLPAGATRVLGHPRIYKPHALLLSCDASGVCERKLTKRALPGEFKQLRKGGFDPLQVMELKGDEVAAMQPLLAATTTEALIPLPRLTIVAQRRNLPRFRAWPMLSGMNAAVLAPEAPTSSIGETITRSMMKVCLEAVREFQDWERANLIQSEPAPAMLAEHKASSGRLIRLLTQLQATAADPDWPLPDSEREITAVLWQLREIYQALHHPMPEAEADRILNEVFPPHGD